MLGAPDEAYVDGVGALDGDRGQRPERSGGDADLVEPDRRAAQGRDDPPGPGAGGRLERPLGEWLDPGGLHQERAGQQQQRALVELRRELWNESVGVLGRPRVELFLIRGMV